MDELLELLEEWENLGKYGDLTLKMEKGKIVFIIHAGKKKPKPYKTMKSYLRTGGEDD